VNEEAIARVGPQHHKKKLFELWYLNFSFIWMSTRHTGRRAAKQNTLYKGVINNSLNCGDFNDLLVTMTRTCTGLRFKKNHPRCACITK
jgi:hypothetical protein